MARPFSYYPDDFGAERPAPPAAPTRVESNLHHDENADDQTDLEVCSPEPPPPHHQHMRNRHYQQYNHDSSSTSSSTTTTTVVHDDNASQRRHHQHHQHQPRCRGCVEYHKHHRMYYSENYDIEFLEQQGWMSVLNLLAFLFSLSIVFLFLMHVYETIRFGNNELLVVAPQILFPYLVYGLTLRQRLRYVIATVALSLPILTVNLYLAIKSVMILFACDDYKICRDTGSMIYVWFSGTLVVLALCSLGILVVSIRVLPALAQIYYHIEQYRLVNYLHLFARKHPKTIAHCESILGVQVDDETIPYSTTTSARNSQNKKKNYRKEREFVLHAKHPHIQSICFRIPEDSRVSPLPFVPSSPQHSEVGGDSSINSSSSSSSRQNRPLVFPTVITPVNGAPDFAV